MASHLRRVALAMLAILILSPALSSPSCADSFVDGWEGVVPDRSAWATYYRSNARVRLGPEQRLPNGVSWRLHMDAASRIAIPRITWMPDGQRMRTANELLDMVHGGAMLFADEMRLRLEGGNNVNRRYELSVLEFARPVTQTDVGLTYATPTLMSLVDLGYAPTGWKSLTRIIRGVTFDLRSGELFRVEACPDSVHPYGAKGGEYRFQFGKLLRVCETETYLKFVQLLSARSALVAERTASGKNSFIEWCSERGGRVVAPHQEIVLYLTARGLAVHNTEYGSIPARDNCALERSPVNPVILPYQELEPFMIPGAWRDELLRLK
jgi:hypothetical protein